MKQFLLCCLFFPVIALAKTPLLANDVFHLQANVKDPNSLVLTWNIQPGYFLYKNRIKIIAANDSNFSLGQLQLPPGKIKTDRLGNRFSIYRQTMNLSVPVLGHTPGEGILEVHYQGCSDDGFCYPPIFKKIKLSFNPELALTAAEPESTLIPSAEKKQMNQFDALFSQRHLPIVLLSFLGFGLLLSFTPCILPMVPVLSGLIIGHGHQITTRKAFFLSLSYVLSMAITYAVVGAIIALLGSNLQIIMQSPWAISFFSLLFVLLALSMFNFYDLRLPVAWQSKIATLTRTQASGHYLSAAIMGCLSTLILSPCVTAPLIGALGYIAHTGNVVFGSLALFTLGLGMGLPLLLIGTSAGKLLPKAGQWMNAVKSFFGVLLLGMAIYVLQRILHPALTMALWGSLLIFSGIYLGALTKAIDNSDKFRQSLGIISLAYGILILIGASKGNINPLQPLVTQQNGVMAFQPHQPVDVITNLTEMKQAIQQAKGKPVLLDFYADWCTACKTIAATTLQNPKVQAAMNDFVVLTIDLSANTVESQKLLRFFNVIAPPTFIFLNRQGKELPHLRLVGDTSVEQFYKTLKEAMNHSG